MAIYDAALCSSFPSISSLFPFLQRDSAQCLDSAVSLSWNMAPRMQWAREALTRWKCEEDRRWKGGGKCKGIVEEGCFATEGVPVENTDYLLSKHQFDGETHAPSQRPPIRLGHSRPWLMRRPAVWRHFAGLACLLLCSPFLSVCLFSPSRRCSGIQEVDEVSAWASMHVHAPCTYSLPCLNACMCEHSYLD